MLIQISMRPRTIGFLLSSALLAGPAIAQGAHGPPGTPTEAAPGRSRSAEAQARYPQAVRVGDLGGRQVLEDVQEQRVLGRVVGVARGSDGTINIVMDHGGLLGFGTRRIAVPVGSVALLGQFLVVKNLTTAQLAALPPTLEQPGALSADAMIMVGLARN